jgi:hypothetical protein
MLRRSGVRRCRYRMNALGRVEALFEIGVWGKVGGGSGGGGTTPSPRTLEVESVPVVWSETTATSACVGEVEATGLFTRRHLSGLDMGNPGWRQVWKRTIYTVVLRAIASVKRSVVVHAWFNSEGHRCGRRLIRAVSFRFEGEVSSRAAAA